MTGGMAVDVRKGKLLQYALIRAEKQSRPRA